MAGQRVLVIAAHPDDEVLGVGGTIARYVDNGAEVILLIVTDGSTSQYRDNERLQEILHEKKLETQRAADILGIHTIVYGNLPDMKLDRVEHIEINQVIENAIQQYKPSVVFTHFDGDVNLDHKCVHQSTMVACRPTPGQSVKEIYSYSVLSATDWNIPSSHTAFMPNVFVDIDGLYAEKKYKAMECYKTELRDYPHPRSIDAMKVVDIANGIHVGLKCAECFIMHRGIR